MTSAKDIDADYDEHHVITTGAEDEAAGVKAVLVSMQRGFEQMGPLRTAAALAKLNQRHGFDCPGCAWPEEHGGRKLAEFCENGAKAVAEEATKRVVTPEFFARHTIAELETKPEYWLSQQGRLTQPMVLAPGDAHYRPIEWDDAYRLIAEHLNALASPDEALFYTSGRTSNEAAFLYQLLVRSFGTNNLPDCSNMCHESSGTALTESIGIGKGSVTVEDVTEADLILIAGQNPGTNHPRMLSVLEKAKGNGAKIIAINPLPEAGLIRFKDPQKVRGVVGHGIPIADEFVQIRLGGDMALFAGLGRLLLEAEQAAPGTVLDREFIEAHTAGFDEYARQTRTVDLATVTEASGIDETQLRRVADMLIASERTVICWAMGLTQHRHAVATIGEATNLLFMRGMIGKPGAGVCPVRGHSNVQGDRTMGIWEKMPEKFLDALDNRFGIASPRKHGYDTVDAIRAMRDGRAKVFVGMGGNFVSATPDTEVTEAGLRSCALTVQISTKLNRSHLVHGRTALILPTLGRTDKDFQAGGKQMVSVEDSMSMVHLSRGSLTPPSEHLRSEVAIVCQLARVLLGPDHPVPWEQFNADYDRIRDAIADVVPGCEDYNRKVRQPDGFQLPHPPRDSREFRTTTGKANFSVQPLEWVPVPQGRLVLQTLRSHDQYNTTIYGLDDRYRGVKGGRRVVFVNPADLDAMGLKAGDRVDLVSEFDGQERRAKDFLIVEYSTPKGNAAAYYPETNPLVPLDHTAKKSNTPVSKAVVIRLERT
ncbi:MULTISPECIES: FdhF/YdeP family oxidoreductase [Mycolicibacterium]|uniref:Oxidoreductase alpha (Molybdopterin) subunit n=2 Tax=Mycolicibacterium TaxID=1866885 RepID=A0A378SYY1_9MYCO|nr:MULTISPECIES: FdhF/YdeP family oxidoreductase [Mycolicibacterium]MCV7338737.1 FdhF/YdeP family oxidoreductase [Mycolicibacterium senegalense]MDR7289556.1 molybdopterin-dependent oxidoreductase alpha subunit [Mycolicibacterium senegalense]QZA26383.1 FdhF/YdeP family oxidoreductase [Mycolicibacterium senegalense]CDP89005.1 oxidoreductase alpha (molybdopterin) subunit [Mycolicibacterium farcinogenes]STZ53729.1 oxidoreductase alpha (Molybdopterin) subunit [Mycolicibacterium senegalense]